MRDRHSTFVTPADGELPRLQPLARLEPVSHVEIDGGAPFARPGVVTNDNRDPLTEAQGFLLKYAGLTAILLVLAVGLALRLELRFDVAIIVFAVMASAAYFALAVGENMYTGPGVERHRLTMGSRVLLAQIDADERVRLAQIRLQRRHLEAQRELNAHTMNTARKQASAQVEAHRLPHARPQLDTEPLRTLRTDPAREALLACIVDLYERGDDGQWLCMDERGYIAKGFITPWSQRGGYTQTERRVMVDLLYRSRFACFDDAKRAWRVSVRRFPTAADAIDVVGGIEVIK